MPADRRRTAAPPGRPLAPQDELPERWLVHTSEAARPPNSRCATRAFSLLCGKAAQSSRVERTCCPRSVCRSGARQGVRLRRRGARFDHPRVLSRRTRHGPESCRAPTGSRADARRGSGQDVRGLKLCAARAGFISETRRGRDSRLRDPARGGRISPPDSSAAVQGFFRAHAGSWADARRGSRQDVRGLKRCAARRFTMRAGFEAA